MDRIWQANASATPPALPSTPANGYAQADPQAPTIPGAWWFHMITEELRAAIVAAGLTPDGGDVTQLAAAIAALGGAAGSVDVPGSYTPGSIGYYINQIVLGLTGAALRAGGNAFTGAQVVAPVDIDDGAVAVNAALSNHFRWTLGGNRQMPNPTGLQDGVILNFKVKQPATGGPRLMTFADMWKWSSGVAPTLSTAANAVDSITAQYWADEGALLATFLPDLR